MGDFTHIDENGQVRMVDVTEKKATLRTASAQAVIRMNQDTFDKICTGHIKKGNVLETARIAGIMGAKKTAELIPMCHPINITHAKIDFSPDPQKKLIKIIAAVSISAQTGVEMEALCAVSTAALTIYDMCKSSDREMIITDICLLEKKGGKSGKFTRSC